MTAAGSSPSGADLPFGERPADQPDLTDADRIRTAVLACPDVADLSAGPFGEVASYLPGRTISGVRIDDDHVEVHIVARFGQPLRTVADRIGDSLQGLLKGRPLSVAVDDILLPGETLDAPVPTTDPSAPA